MSELTPEQLTAAETMSLDDLRNMAPKAAEEAEATPAPVQQKEQPRAADGKFAAKTAAEAVEAGAEELDNSGEEEVEEPTPTTTAKKSEEVEDEVEEYIFEKKIDLGDGSGVQIFRGRGATKEEALSELADKLADAQTNASRTINEFRKKHPKEPEKPKAKEFTAQEELIYTQEFQTKPTEAFKKMYKEIFGQSVEESQQTLSEAKEAVAHHRALLVQQNFVNTHPDYIANPLNAKAMEDWAQAHNQPEFSEANLEKAYQDLKKGGLLKLRSEGADVVTEGSAADKGGLPKSDGGATQQQSQRKGSTLSTTKRSAPVVKTQPSEDDAYSMPMDKLRELANRQLSGRE